MVKLPDKIKIHTFTYTIREEKEPKTLDGAPVYGYCEWKNNLICLDKALPKDRKQTILVHELLHAIFDAINFSIKDTPPADVEETLCTDGGPMLLSVLKDNPKLVKYLLS